LSADPHRQKRYDDYEKYEERAPDWTLI